MPMTQLHQHNGPARQEGEHRPPAEPPKCIRHQAPSHGALRRPTQLASEKRRLNEVEVVENTNPGDPCEKVKPAKQKFPSLHCGNKIHKPPLTIRFVAMVDCVQNPPAPPARTAARHSLSGTGGSMRNSDAFSELWGFGTSISSIPQGNPVHDRVPAQTVKEHLDILPACPAIAQIRQGRPHTGHLIANCGQILGP